VRRTGIRIVGDAPWGTHFCQFYEDRQDLIEILVPYFKAGLEHNECCMWVTSEPLGVEDAAAALAREVGNLDDYIGKGQLEILDYRQWYTAGGKFDSGRVLQGWVEKLDSARRRGFDGLRLTGNTFWLETGDWHDFTEYEATVDHVIARYPMLAICTYSLHRCGAAEIMDVVANHAFALVKRAGQWQIVESAGRKHPQEQADEVNADLEQRVSGRTAELRAAFRYARSLIEASLDPLITISPDGRVTDVNHATELATGVPRERLVGSDFAAYFTDPLKAESGYRQVLAEGLVQDYPLALRHVSGRTIDVLFNAVVYRNDAGEAQGVFAAARDVTERKQIEEKLRATSRYARSLLEASLDPLVTISREGKITARSWLPGSPASG
jgi:PAS domain S-box-containing protein